MGVKVWQRRIANNNEDWRLKQPRDDKRKERSRITCEGKAKEMSKQEF